MKYISISPTEACTTMTTIFGTARRSNVRAIGASISRRVRGSTRTWPTGGAAVAGRTVSVVKAFMFTLPVFGAPDPFNRRLLELALECRLAGSGGLGDRCALSQPSTE